VRQFLGRLPSRSSVALLLAAACGAALAQTQTQTAPANQDAEVRRMIESLRGAGGGASGSRTRTLVIEAVPSTPASTSSSTSPAAPAAPTAAAAAAPAAARPEAPSLSLAIGFEPNSAQLRPDSGATLGALVAAMLSSELRTNRFLIEGHTDASGAPAQNLRLSRDRAEQVRLYLVTLGVDGQRLRAVGKGSSEPVNARDPRAAENRRVRVVLVQ
jgi:outer membrane protein OmpA-like peptidoglycan-associated protein